MQSLFVLRRPVKKWILAVTAVAMIFSITEIAVEYGVASDAKAMVGKAIAHIKKIVTKKLMVISLARNLDG